MKKTLSVQSYRKAKGSQVKRRPKFLELVRELCRDMSQGPPFNPLPIGPAFLA